MSALALSRLIFDHLLHRKPPRREALEEVVLVERLPLAVDPAVAERDLQGLGTVTVLLGGLLGDLEPDPLLVPVVRSSHRSQASWLAKDLTGGSVAIR